VINVDSVRNIVADQYAAGIEAQYGSVGIARLRAICLALGHIHEALAYEMLTRGLTVFATLDHDARPLGSDDVMTVTASQLSALVTGAATIQVIASGELLLQTALRDPIELSVTAVVYHYTDKDYFVVDGRLQPVTNITNFPSMWGVPTFFDLDDALEHYRDSIAMTCSCPILQTAWHDPNRRWIFINKPEDTLQQSLTSYLRMTLRTHKRIEIRREQPIGQSRPPDIKVTWTMTNRIALIEVKWMGASVNERNTGISWQPGERDANEGAQQLAEYLDLNADEAPSHQTRGHLVVYDGRRLNIRLDSTALSRDEAYYYVTREVAWEPDYSVERHDFARPVRFFIRPAMPAQA
jgi:hypothetical protein